MEEVLTHSINLLLGQFVFICLVGRVPPLLATQEQNTAGDTPYPQKHHEDTEDAVFFCPPDLKRVALPIVTRYK